LPLFPEGSKESGSIKYQDFQSAQLALQMPIFMASGLQIPMNEDEHNNS
jgi:hypothetical protein